MLINVYEYIITNLEGDELNYKFPQIIGECPKINHNIPCIGDDAIRIIRDETVELHGYVEEHPERDSFESVYVITREISSIHQGDAASELENTNTHSYILEHKNRNIIYVSKHKKNKISAKAIHEYLKLVNKDYIVYLTPRLLDAENNEIIQFCNNGYVKKISLKAKYCDLVERHPAVRHINNQVENDTDIASFSVTATRGRALHPEKARGILDEVLDNIDLYDTCELCFDRELQNGKKKHNVIKDNKCVIEFEEEHNGLTAILNYLYENRDISCL